MTGVIIVNGLTSSALSPDSSESIRVEHPRSTPEFSHALIVGFDKVRRCPGFVVVEHVTSISLISVVVDRSSYPCPRIVFDFAVGLPCSPSFYFDTSSTSWNYGT
jgi:hypothetical protein